MKFISVFLFFLAITAIVQVDAGKKTKCVATTEMFSNGFKTVNLDNSGSVVRSNTCVTFSVSQGTGCAWMCNYCANTLGTNNYYFTNGVCIYDPNAGYCVGNPQVGVQYTCCSA